MLFRDRRDAGRALAEALSQRGLRDPVVLALPRGGVPVGYEVAVSLNAPLDIVLVRKIGAPSQPELALGAVVDGETPEFVINEEISGALGTPQSYIEEEGAIQLREIERRRKVYLEGRNPVSLQGSTAVIVDDGIATGATVRAALRATRRRQPASILLAVPVAPAETIAALRDEADEVVCLHTPADFDGVGQFYAKFPQVDDATVAALLRKRAAEIAAQHAPR